MLLTGKDALLHAQQHRRALGAFTVYNIELTHAVISAAEKVGVPVLLQAGSSGFHYVDEEVLGAVALTMATQAPTPVGSTWITRAASMRCAAAWTGATPR